MQTESTKPSRVRGRLWLLGAAVCVAIVAVGGWLSISLGGDETAATPTPEEQRRQPVHAIAVERGPIQSWVFAQGTARSTQRKYLSFERNGPVTFGIQGLQRREIATGVKVGER